MPGAKKHPHPANTTTSWYLADSQENYLKKPHPVYDDKSISYTWNSHGYRSDEFDPGADAIMVLGCSHTMGFGLPTEHAWPWMLRDRINPKLKLYNLAISGASCDCVVRTAYKVLAILQPRYLFVLWPDLSRREVQLDQQYLLYNVHAHSSEYPALFLDHGYQKYQQDKNEAMLKSLCNMPVYTKSLHNQDGTNYPDLARDWQHNGLSWNQMICNYFYDQLK